MNTDMTSSLPECVWVTKDDDDISADIAGELYADYESAGMVGKPTKYVREDLHLAIIDAITKNTKGVANWLDAVLELIQATSCEPDNPDDFDEVLMCAGMQLEAYYKSSSTET